MKRAIIIIGICLFAMNLAGPVHCDDAIKKLGRGVCNVITSPFEIFSQASRVNSSDGPLAAYTYGILKGVGMTGVRAIVGAYEVVTFPVSIPKKYAPILKDPEFFFEDSIW